MTYPEILRWVPCDGSFILTSVFPSLFCQITTVPCEFDVQKWTGKLKECVIDRGAPDTDFFGCRTSGWIYGACRIPCIFLHQCSNFCKTAFLEIILSDTVIASIRLFSVPVSGIRPDIRQKLNPVSGRIPDIIKAGLSGRISGAV
jgi:hypothetical protein